MNKFKAFYKNLKLQKNEKEDEKGFIALIGLLIVVVIIGIWFVKVYSTPKNTNGKTQMNTYKDAIKDAENVKALMEAKQVSI